MLFDSVNAIVTTAISIVIMTRITVTMLHLRIPQIFVVFLSL